MSFSAFSVAMPLSFFGERMRIREWSFPLLQPSIFISRL